MMLSRLLTIILAREAGAAVAEPGDGPPLACNADEHGVERSLLQQSRNKFSAEQARQEVERANFFPKDIIGQWKQATDIAKGIPGLDHLADVVGNVESAVEGAAARSLTTLGGAIDAALQTLAAKADDFDLLANESQHDVADGVASVMSRALGLSVDSVPVSHEYEAKALATMDKAVAMWDTLEDSAQRATLVLTSSLAAIGQQEAANTFNSTLQSAFLSADTFSAPLRRVRGILSGDPKRARSVREARKLLEQVEAELRVAKREVEVFPKVFDSAFKTLELKVTDLATSQLGPDAEIHVHNAFANVEVQANAVAQKFSRSTFTLLSGIDAGIATVSRNVPGAAVGLAPNRVAMCLVLSVLASTV